MNILELHINDLKRISAIEINPKTGEPVILTGDNGNGKSSVLDSILFGLTNSGLDDPIRHGRPSGQVRIVLGADKAQCTIERRATKKGSYLTVTNADGLKIDKAQTFLNGLLGNYAFDPLEFTRLKPKQQVEALKEAAGLDFGDLDQKRAEAYAERTQIGREGKNYAAQLEAVPEPPEGTPEEEVSASKLIDDLRELEAKIANAAECEKLVDVAKERVTQSNDKVSDLMEQLKEAEARLKEDESDYIKRKEDHYKSVLASPSEEQLQAARSAIDEVDGTNRAVRNLHKHRELTGEVKKLRAKYAELDRTIESIDEEKARIVSETALPLDGLEFTEDGVMFKGTYFNQLSTAEQIRISSLVAMAQNPKLRIIMIREGALMNSENLRMITELAKGENYQLWIEKFQETPGDTGLHIVDGSIAFENGEPTDQ